MHFISSLVAVQMSVSGLILVSKLDIYSAVHHSEALHLFGLFISRLLPEVLKFAVKVTKERELMH